MEKFKIHKELYYIPTPYLGNSNRFSHCSHVSDGESKTPAVTENNSVAIISCAISSKCELVKNRAEGIQSIPSITLT